MNKMMKVKHIASEISEIIETINEKNNKVDDRIREANESLNEMLSEEDPNEWDIGYRKSVLDDFIAQKEAIVDIIKYLESYKF